MSRTELLREVERDRLALVELRLPVNFQRRQLPEQDRCTHTHTGLSFRARLVGLINVF